MKKTRQIANGVALIITVAINYLSSTGLFNGNTMASVSSRYQNYFTPAGYAFSIWGLIYLSLFGFVIYQGRSLFRKTENDEVVQKIGWWFVVSCAANSAWVIAFLYGYTGLSVLVMVVLFFSLLKIILNTGMELENAPLKVFAFVWWPFCLYSGWIAVALIANVAVWLTKIDWNGFGIRETTWAIVMIVVAGAVNLFMTWNRNMREFGLVGVWALVAIAVANRGEAQAVVLTALFVAAIVLVSSGIHSYKNRKSLPFLK